MGVKIAAVDSDDEEGINMFLVMLRMILLGCLGGSGYMLYAGINRQNNQSALNPETDFVALNDNCTILSVSYVGGRPVC